MPSSRQTEPIIIAASKPSHNPSTISLSTPPSSKQVRFAPQSAKLASRPLTPQEAWALYHFETHARGCRSCSNQPLCSTGYGLAQDVHVLVCQHGGEICSTRPDNEGKWIRVEIPHSYGRAKSMLGVERKRKTKHAPIVNYETDPRPAPKQEPRDNVRREHTETTRGAEGEPIRLPERVKRGSLYESHMRRPRREYRIEEVLPKRGVADEDRAWKEREREERRERRRRERAWQEGMLLPKREFERDASRHATYDQSFVPVQSNQSLARGTEFTRVDKDTLEDDDMEVKLARAMAEEEHISLPCEGLEALESDHATDHQDIARSEARVPNDIDAGIEDSISAAARSADISTQVATSDSSSSMSNSASLQSLVLSTGCYTATDAFTTAPSALSPGHKSIGHEPAMLTDFDASTIGLSPNVNREYASTFARCLKEAVGMTDEQTSLLVASNSMIADILQTYASMLGSQPETQHHTAVKFVHRQRKMIGDLIRDLEYISPPQSNVSAEEPTHKERFPEAESTRNITEWLEGVKNGGNLLDPDSGPDLHKDDGAVSWPKASLIEDSEVFLRAGLPWKWLTTRLSSWARLSWPQKGSDDEVSRMVTATMQSSSKRMQTALCHLAWDPVSFLSMNYNQKSPPRLGEVITMTGWDNQVQSATCSEYIQQTWPLYGMGILYAVQDAIRSPDLKTHRILDDDLFINICLLGSQTSITVQGQTPLLSQVIAQFAWLGAACRTSPDPEQNCFTTAHIESSPDSGTGFNIDFSFDFQPPPKGSSCWLPFCCYASIACGFPVSARHQGEDGLELGLELMATLAGVDYATSFRGNFVLKGFASMLIPAVRNEHSITWHFIHDHDGGHLPYTALDAFECVSSLNIGSLSSHRHFVGWVSAAELCFDIDLSRVRQPSRLETISRLVLEKASISGGKFINAGLVFGIGNQLKPLWRSPRDSYARAIGEARQWPIVLYDSDTKRAWLEDGASALLQITHGQLRSDRFIKLHRLESAPDLRLTCANRKGGDEAMSILLDPHNQWLELFHEASGPVLKRKWNEQGRFLGEHPEQNLKSWSFRDQVQENFELLAQMLGHQQDPTSGTRMRFSGKERLEGWSFRDVLDERTVLEPKVIHLEPSGRGWEPFAREINALVLMGGGFGDIITPGRQLASCCNWDRVPQGHDLLVATYGYLEEIAAARRADNFPRHLTPSTVWHQPDALFQGPCKTGNHTPADTTKSTGCGRVQVLLSSKLLEFLPSRRLGLLKCPTAQIPTTVLSPAVIFGRPRRKWLPGDFINIKPSFKPVEQAVNSSAQRRRHLTKRDSVNSTTRTKIPLPVFKSLLRADDTGSESTSGSLRSQRTSGAESLNASASTLATSISPLKKSEEEPDDVLFLNNASFQSVSQPSPIPGMSNTQESSSELLDAIKSRLPVPRKPRNRLPHPGQAIIARQSIQNANGSTTAAISGSYERLINYVAYPRTFTTRATSGGATLATLGKMKELRIQKRNSDGMATSREAYHEDDIQDP